MDFEELIGVLFTLYILGSMVAGFFRRGAGGRKSGSEGRAKGTGLPRVLDMDELERRLRELATGRRVPEPEPEPQAERVAASPPTTTAVPTKVSIPAVVSDGPKHRGGQWTVPEDGWEELPDPAWAAVEERPVSRRAAVADGLPPVVADVARRDNPWQAAFVIKELLGPPRALAPHRGRPRF